MTRTLRILGPHLRGQRTVFAVAGVSTVLVVVAEVAKPIPLKLIVDFLVAFGVDRSPSSFGFGDVLFLGGVAALVLAIAGLEAVAVYQMELRLRRVGEGVTHALRVAVYAHLQRLSLAFHDRSRQGDLVTRTTGDVQAVGQLFSESIGTLASSVLLFAGMLVVSLLIDPLLALAAFSIAPIIGVLTFLMRRRAKVAARRQRSKEGEIASVATESLSAMRAVKALGSEQFERRRLELVSEERQAAGLQAGQIESRFTGAVNVLSSVSVAVVLVVGAFRVVTGAISPGDLVVIASYARRLQRPLRDFAREAGRMARSLVRAERVADVLASDEILREPDHPYRGPRVRGDIALERVKFAYSPDRPVLNDLSIRVAAGRKLALAGPSGAGKSTIAALIARFHDPTAGRVTIDGHDLRVCSVSWLREQVGLVLQDTILFTGTVAENIGYGTRASRADIVRAATAAGANEFIARLPDGYDTLLGSRGAALSGGQRQRIAIARTVLRNPAVVILDEPTTGLDPVSEATVLTGLASLLEGRTTIIITHSQALAAWADEVVAIRDGRIVTHATDAPPLAPAPPSRPAVASAGTPLPQDAALPGLPALLDPATMSEVLGRTLAGRAASPPVAIRYLRYKPETNLVVQYAALVDGQSRQATAMIASGNYLERRARKPENVALAARVDGRSPSTRPMAYDTEVGCLVQWLPLDIALPALAERPEQLRRRLRSNGVTIAISGDEPELLAYKPRRRAVLRVGRSVVKAYASEAQFAVAAAALAASAKLPDVSVPRFEGALPSIRLTAQSYVAGQTMPDPVQAAPAAGALLATLHATDADRNGIEALPAALPARQLRAAAASVELVSTIAPQLAARVGRLLEVLEASMPSDAALVPSHGDFNARQLLAVEDGLALTDFDELCVAPRALDVATYVAYVVRGDPDATAPAAEALSALLGTYGGRPPHLGWYLATMLLRRAPRPFRYFERDWPVRVETMVGMAEAAREW